MYSIDTKSWLCFVRALYLPFCKNRNSSSRLEDTTGWLLTDSASSWQGTPSDRGWRYLQQALKRHDNIETDHRYSKASLEAMLNADSLAPPPWLIETLEVMQVHWSRNNSDHIWQKYQPEYLIRVSLRYENIIDAVHYTLAFILKVKGLLAMLFWLDNNPYHIDWQTFGPGPFKTRVDLLATLFPDRPGTCSCRWPNEYSSGLARAENRPQ